MKVILTYTQTAADGSRLAARNQPPHGRTSIIRISCTRRMSSGFVAPRSAARVRLAAVTPAQLPTPAVALASSFPLLRRQPSQERDTLEPKRPASDMRIPRIADKPRSSSPIELPTADLHRVPPYLFTAAKAV